VHHSIHHLIQRHLDGELSDAQRAEFERLLERSPEAREELRRAEQIRSIARRTATVRQPSPWVEQELMAMVRATPPRATAPTVGKAPEATAVRNGRMRRRAATFAAVACMLLLALEISDAPLSFIGTGEDGIASALRVPSVVAPRLQTFTSPTSIPASINRRRIAVREQGVENRERNSWKKEVEMPTPMDIPSAYATVVQTQHAPETRPDAPSTPTAQSVRDAALDPPTRIPHDTWTPVVENASLLSASVRGGYAGIRRDNWVTANEMQVRLGLQVSPQDQLYAVVGSAPTITETRYRNSGLAISSSMSNGQGKNDEGKRGSPRVLASAPPELRVTFDDELWGGIGYRRTLLESRAMQLAASAQAGTSGTAARFAGELSGSVRVLPRLSLEVSGSVTQVLPFAREVEQSMAVDAGDHALYNSTIRQPAFVSVGAQVGVRVDLP